MLFCSTSCISDKKKVRFSSFIREFRNPTLIERSHFPYLWWSELDKSTARYNMYNEIQNLQKIHPTITVKQAMKLLYQPDNLTRYDPNNFL
jgi:hypothetical protein